MWRKMAGYAALGLLISASIAMAEEVKGKMTKVDPTGHKITMKVDGKEQEFVVDKECKMPKYKGKDGKEKTSSLNGLKGMVEKAKSGVEATLITSKKDDKTVVTEIKDVSYSDQKKKDSDKKNKKEKDA